ncbi:MAG: intradiol ring-cleavage dioxygenase [Acidobacteriaceae bacterium]|nr:intradiol ring-cleavage dioxygenase [Acidobacteriaceae bacterium]
MIRTKGLHLIRTSRRNFLSTAAAAATGLQFSRYAIAATAAPATACTLISEQEVGPFYVADELLRSSIAEDRPGVPLSLRIVLQDVRTCQPISNAAIDLWHCDAAGLYSGYTTTSLGPPPGEGDGPPPGGFSARDRPGPPPNGGDRPPAMKPSDKLTFCRGIQLSDADGAVEFQTIFPGFYQGRTNHIHFKVRIGGHTENQTYAAGHTSHTGQVFFPEDFILPLMAQEPYSSHHIHRTTQTEDGIFTQQQGSRSMAQLVPAAPHYRAELTVAVDPTATPKPVGGRPGSPR